MVFNSEDKIFIKNLVLLKGYSSRSRRRVGINMASMYCCERIEKRPAWIVSQVWYGNLSGVVICPDNSNINIRGVVIGSRDQRRQMATSKHVYAFNIICQF